MISRNLVKEIVSIVEKFGHFSKECKQKSSKLKNKLFKKG